MKKFAMNIEKAYIGIPVAAEKPEKMLEIFLGDRKLHEFQVPDSEEEPDYYSYINVEEYKGKELTFKGELSEKFFDRLIQSEDTTQEPLVRPLIHFTTERGWINDPNGLVYQNGTFQLFYQYNPVNTKWQNMSWGHAVTKDLLRFQYREPALFPDEYGTAFSGCGIVNEKGMLGLQKDALLFYYTAAGDANEWSKGRKFTQRIAYSTDGGETLKKSDREAVGVIEKDSRDPKVFWHEESNAYVMVLWIQGNEFGILRSENLQDWKQVSSFTLPEAWECPDLFRLQGENETKWVFTSADGFYYFGEFDGFTFHTDGVQRKLYLDKLPYAAQSYSGVQDRTILVPWLRTLNKGKLYTGAMALPRELALVTTADKEVRVSMSPVREYENEKKKCKDFTFGEAEFADEITEDVVTEIYLELEGKKTAEVEFFGKKLVIRKDALVFGEETTALPEAFDEVHILIDRQILEVYGNKNTLNAYFETCSDELQGKIKISGGEGCGKLYQWKA